MDMQLAGKTAFVSGSSSGIGKGIALHLAAEGCNVVVHGRDRTRTEETAQEVSRLNVRTAVTIGNLATDAGAKEACDAALAALGGIDILVNNCGVVLHPDNPDPMTLPPQEWIASYEVNFMSGLRCSQRFAPGMAARNWGRIINISSAAGTHVMNGAFPDYGAAKAAVNKFTVDLSKLLGPKGITVNVIIPGTIRTPAIDEYMRVLKTANGWSDDPVENERRYTEVHPQSVPRLGTVDDIGTAAAFLASPLAGYINGATLRIDGGMADFV